MFLNRNHVKVFLIASSILASGTIPPAASQGAAGLPKFVDFTLAGTRISLSQKDFHKYDSRTDYHLFGEKHPFRNEIMMVLMPDPEGGARGARRVKFPSLRSGRGISIRDTPQQVRSKLGEPTKIITDDMDGDGKKEALLYDYSTVIRIALPGSKKTVNRVYSGTYMFTNNRLKKIAFSLAAPDGK